MRVAVVLLGVLVVAGISSQDPPTPQPTPAPIRFPEVTPPPPKPTPKPEPIPISKLGAGQLYVIDSDVPCTVLGSPDGLVKISAQPGPVAVNANFVDGLLQETRMYTGKFVFLVEGRKSGVVELITIPHGFKTEADIIRRTLTVEMGTGPRPPPGPTPPEPAPPAPTSFQVLFVVETGQAIPQGQFSAIYGKQTFDYLNRKCTPADGQPGWRIFDQNTDLSKMPKGWQDALKRPRTQTPWLIVYTGTVVYEGPVPATTAETLALLQKFGGP